MNILSLCSGYGGLDLAVEELLGARTRWVAEIEPHAQTVLAARFPDALNLGNIRPLEDGSLFAAEIDWQSFRGDVDVLTAGYPCQPFSQAGKRLGADDDRHLWPFVAEAISGARPRLVVLENVRGHLRLGLDRVLADLASMGYNARWGVVRASDAGAPHRRARLFVAASPDADGNGRVGFAQSNGSTGSLVFEPRRDVDGRCVDYRRHLGASPPDANAPRCERLHGWGDFAPAVRRWEGVVGRAAPPAVLPGTRTLSARFVEWMMGLPAGWVTDLVPNRAALGMIGNGVCPQQAKLALSLLLGG